MPALSLDRIVKRFGAVTALDGASIDVPAGTLHALLGENGAGKTTLMRVAFGMLAPDAGELRVDGVARRFASPADAIAAGIGMVHQHFTIVPAMTVAENVALGGRGRYDARRAAARVREVAERAGLALDPSVPASELGVAGQQRLEIVKALARDARLLVLDEPTAVLTPGESRELLQWLRRYVDAGNGVVLITHKLRDALSFADTVTVLRRGVTVATLPARDATESALATLMVGERPEWSVAAAEATGIAESAPGRDAAASPAPSAGPVVVRADDVRVRDARGVERVRGASFVVRAGEIVGVAAVEGSGQRELLRALAGRATATGTLQRPDRVAFVPEDRQHDALLLDATLAENVALRGAGARRGILRWGEVRARTALLMSRFDVRAGGAGAGAAARALSGGNQQKLVVARELAADGDDAPPRGVAATPRGGRAPRARAAVLARLRDARRAGAAVVIHSTDLDEVLAIADRVLVVHDGEVREVPLDRELVGRAMLGA